MPRTRAEAECRGSYTYNPSVESDLPCGKLGSPVANLGRKYHCNLKCRWATKKPSCIRSQESLIAYFKEHGRFSIVYREYADKYPECPLCEPRST